MPAITAPFRMEQLGDTLYLAVSSAHTFGSDAFLLARFAGEALRRGDAAADLGTGCGIIAFLLYKNRRPRAVWGVDIQPAAIRQFEASLRYSEEKGEDFAGILRPLEADLNDLKGKLPFDAFDLVTCNPPYKAAAAASSRPKRLTRSPAMSLPARWTGSAPLPGSSLEPAGGCASASGRNGSPTSSVRCGPTGLNPKRVQAVAKDGSSDPG